MGAVHARGALGVMSDGCAFCHDAAVLNAGAWVAPNVQTVAACPRCGRTFCPSCGEQLTGDECHVCSWAWERPES